MKLIEVSWKWVHTEGKNVGEVLYNFWIMKKMDLHYSKKWRKMKKK